MIDKAAVGDKLVVSAVYGGARRIVRVTKVTPSGQFSCDDGQRYSSRGEQIGTSRWNRVYARLATEEDIIDIGEERERHALRGKLDELTSRCDWTKAPIEKVRAYAKALAEAEQATAKLLGVDDDGQHGVGA